MRYLSVVVFALSCTNGPRRGAPQPVEPEPVAVAVPAEVAAPQEVCRALKADDVLVRFSGTRCPWILTEVATGLVLQNLEIGAQWSAQGPVPRPCEGRPCDWDGVVTPLGPLVVASVRSPDSELAGGAVLGVVVGDAIRFIDLWDGAGDGVWADATAVGPAFALVPHMCDTELGLFARARLHPSRGEAPPASLLAREGIYRFETEVLLPEPADKLDCVKLKVPVP